MTTRRRLTIAVANLKGGTTKTTSAGYIAYGLQRRGRMVLGVDADPPGSLLRWAELGGWELPVIGLPTRAMHQRLEALGQGYDTVVIDTPPLDEQAGIVYSVLRSADVVIIPVSPTTMELDRLSPILDAVEEVGPLRAVPSTTLVLLTRTVANALSTGGARTAITAAGIAVMKAQVPRREVYAQAFGTIPTIRDGDPYDEAVTEILEAAKR